MLRKLKTLEGYAVTATDGDIGSVADFFLDDERWIVRYLIVATGGLFEQREVLISPISFRELEWSTKRFQLALTKDRVRNSPSVEVDKPVSRQYEWEFSTYYEYSRYWGYPETWGKGAYPSQLASSLWRNEPIEPSSRPNDVHLRSTSEVRGYHIQGSDEDIGRVEDFIVDDETWEVRYLVIDTSHWWFGRKVLIAPKWANRISWAERNVHVDLSRDSIENCPKWDASVAISREFEAKLHDHFERTAYWDGDEAHALGGPPKVIRQSSPVAS